MAEGSCMILQLLLKLSNYTNTLLYYRSSMAVLLWLLNNYSFLAYKEEHF